MKLVPRERRLQDAREFVCSGCVKPEDETLGSIRGALKKCSRCPKKLYALLVVQPSRLRAGLSSYVR